MTRTPSSLAAAALGALALAGCGDGPLQAGAAATVGDERITTTELDEVVQRGLADPTAQQNVGTDKPGFERSVLRRLIDHEVLVRHGGQGAGHRHARRGPRRARPDRRAGRRRARGCRPRRSRPASPRRTSTETVRDVALRDALADKLTASIAIPAAELAGGLPGRTSASSTRSTRRTSWWPATRWPQQILKLGQGAPRAGSRRWPRSTPPTPAARTRAATWASRAAGPSTRRSRRPSSPTSPARSSSCKTPVRLPRHPRHRAPDGRRSSRPRNELRRGLLGAAAQRRRAAAAGRAPPRTLDVHVNPRFGTWDPDGLDVVAARSSRTA